MKLEEDPDVVAERGLEAGRVGSERCCWTSIGKGLEESGRCCWMGIGRVGYGWGLEGTSMEGLNPDVVDGRVGRDVGSRRCCWKGVGSRCSCWKG